MVQVMYSKTIQVLSQVVIQVIIHQFEMKYLRSVVQHGQSSFVDLVLRDNALDP